MDSMVEVLAGYADRQPERLFVADHKGNTFSYREAWTSVRRAAAFFAKQPGLSAGDRVMVECCQDCAYLLSDLACELAGLVFVPIEDSASSERIRAIWEETEARLFITHRVGRGGLDTLSFATLFSGGALWDGPAFPDAADTAEILYTTGTTGKSKGIVITNGANVALAENIRFGVEMAPHSVELIPVPISHSHGLRCCYANLLNGGSIVLSDGLLNLKLVFSLMDRYSVTAMDLSPSAAQLLIRISKGAFWERGKSLDYIQLGTAALPEGLKEQMVRELPGVRLYNFYGSTESGRSCVLDFHRESGRKNCIGKPTKNAEIVFTDEERRMIRATPEQPGLLACRGKMNMSCYWKNPDLTRAILRDGFVFTNDLGYIDGEGYVYVLGRKDDVINYNGIKIAPEEIEEVAVRHPDVADAACVPSPDRLAGQVPVLYISIRDGAVFDMRDYLGFLQAHLDGNKIPKRVQILDRIPRTENGKLRRKELMR